MRNREIYQRWPLIQARAAVVLQKKTRYASSIHVIERIFISYKLCSSMIYLSFLAHYDFFSIFENIKEM